MKKCQFCMKEIADDAAFCQWCGKPQQFNNEQQCGSSNSDSIKHTKKDIYVTRKKERSGPFNMADIEERIADRRLSITDLMWFEGMKDWQPIYVFTNTSEANKALEHAEDMRPEDGNDDPKNWLEFAGEMSLAIKKAGGYTPRGHALLGLAYIKLNDAKKAKVEFETSVAQDKYYSLARGMLILFAMDELGIPQGIPKNTGSGVVDFTSIVIGVSVARWKVIKLSNMIDEMVAAYPYDLRSSVKVGYWLGASDIMLTVHDTVQNIEALSNKDRIVRAILDAPWDKVEATEDEKQQIEDIKHRAERRLAMIS
jgi:hypothetical protein